MNKCNTGSCRAPPESDSPAPGQHVVVGVHQGSLFAVSSDQLVLDGVLPAALGQEEQVSSGGDTQDGPTLALKNVSYEEEQAQKQREAVSTGGVVLPPSHELRWVFV